MSHRLAQIGLALSLLLAAPASEARSSGKRARLEQPAQRTQSTGRSIGSPNAGHLVGGAHLDPAPYVRVVPVYAEGDARWGVGPLVHALERAARSVRRQFKDSVLSVGHISKKGGGAIDRHASHESGRDADVGFYVKDQKGKPIYADHFVPFKGDGTAPSWPGALFDDARNWAFVASIVGDGHAHVTYVFVATPIRKRLLAYAAKIGAPVSLRDRAAALMVQPRGVQPHDDHFHIRVACPVGANRCVERPVPRRHRAAASATAREARPHGRGHPKPSARHEPAAPPPAKKTAPPEPPPAEDDDDDATKQAAESEMPSLAPIVPGLDSVVIPKPLGLVKPNTSRP